MDSLFHFIFPLMAALAARIHIRHGIETVFGLALATVLLDLDVFFLHRMTLHNVFIVFFLPLVIILLAFKYERRGTYYKTLGIALLLFLSSHTILDMGTEGGVALFYPLSEERYSFSFEWKADISGYPTTVISSQGVALMMYFVLVLLVLFLEDFFRVLKVDKTVGKTLKDTIIKEERKIKKAM